MTIERIHHVAYRCRDARETVHWSKPKNACKPRASR